MEAALTSLGLNQKEQRLYLLLIDSDLLSASEVAQKINESRTNTYMLLDDLVEKGLAIENTAQPVKRFEAANPKTLMSLLNQKATELEATKAQFKPRLDDLESQYRLARNRPGVASGEGLDNFEATLRAMERSNTPILIFGSADTPENPKAYEVLKKRIYRRKRKDLPAKILFHKDEAQEMLRKEFETRGFDAKFIGDTPFAGEVVVYDDTVVFTTYVPALVTTTITDERLAATVRTIFNLLWSHADT